MKKKTAKKPSKHDRIANFAEYETTHDATETICRTANVLNYQLAMTDAEIMSLRSKIAATLRAKKEIEARINGVERVLAKR